MKPTLLDANAILRYVLCDIPEQASQTEEAIRLGAEVSVEVIAECVYVLDGVYKVPRKGVADTLAAVLAEVSCDRLKVASAALAEYGACRLDFVDCVLIAEASVNRKPVLTFDRKLKKRIDAALS